MNRIFATIIVLAVLGMFFISLACGGDGYEGGDPKNQPAREAGGVTEDPVPMEPPADTQIAPSDEPGDGD